jgi:hypothetical protein
MSIQKVYEDIGEMWKGAYFSMLDDEPGVIDLYQRNIVHSFGNHLVAEHGFFDFDLGEIGLTITKWTKFTGQYVDVESLHAWVNNAMNVKTYDALWTFKIVPPNFTGKKAVHQWGNCLMGFSFRRQPKPPTLTLYTRAQSLGFSGVADYALCHLVAKKLAERMGIPQDKIRIQIFCANFIIKVVETVHTLSQLGLLEEYMEKDNRMAEAIRYYYNYMMRPEEEIKWRAARRMKKKYTNIQEGVHHTLLVDNLDLKGWTAHTRRNRILTSQQASELVLAGKGRRGSGEIDLETDDAYPTLEGPLA